MITTIYDRKATMAAAWQIVGNAKAVPSGVEMILDHALKITPTRATEYPHTPSIIARLFLKLNGALAVAIEAECDLDHGNGCDPAIDSWLREAERAWRVVADIRLALQGAPVTHAGDAALLSMARIVNAVMNSDNSADFGAADNRLRAATFFRQRFGRGALPQRISKMLDQCHAHLSAVVRMELYQPVCDPEDLPYGLSEAWPAAY